MSKRSTALLLIAFGLLMMILMGFGLADEIRRTDIPETQKVFGAWISLVAISILPFVTGLHYLVPQTLDRRPN